MKVVSQPLCRVGAGLAIAAEHTVLHEMVANEPAHIEIDGVLARIPRPRLKVVRMQVGTKQVPVVQLRPPWSTMDEIVRARVQGKHPLEHVVQLAREVIGYRRTPGEYGRALMRAAQYELPCIWAKLVGHPDVEPGEVWITFGRPTARVLFQRFPQASSTSCMIRPAKRVTNYPYRAILVHPDTLCNDLQGDSDGDEGFAAYLPDEPPAPHVTVSTKVHDAQWTIQPQVQPNADWDSLYWGYTATRWIGQIIQAVWVLQYAHAARIGDTRTAATQVWDFATKLIEEVMDTRKLKAEGSIDPRRAVMVLRGQEEPDEAMKALPFAEEVLRSAELIPMMTPNAAPYLVLMRRTRPRAVLQTLHVPPQQLVQQLWSGKLAEEVEDEITGVQLVDPR